jgi:hypothetical protein
MKKLIFLAALITTGFYANAQATLAFPFQGGQEVMDRFFKENIVLSQDITGKLASGTVVFKFTADDKGSIRKIIIYYADDASLTFPLVDAIKKSNSKWIIPDHEKLHDFILPFRIRFNAGTDTAATQKLIFDFYRSRQPILATDQIPLDEVSLLPVVEVVYDAKIN